MIKTGFIAGCVVLILILTSHAKAQDISILLKEAQQFEAMFKDKEALQKYLNVLKIQPNHLVTLCKCSELYNLLGRREPSKEVQKEYYKTAKNYAQRALTINPNYAEANFVMALAIGRIAMISSRDEKIKAAKQIKVYADKCIQLEPNNFKGYHILGKWHYEISDLNSFERWLVKVTYGGLPPSSLNDAIRNYERSLQLNPGFLLNYLELAKAYKRNGDEAKAVELLNAMSKLPSRTSDDNSIKQKGKKLLEDWR